MMRIKFYVLVTLNLQLVSLYVRAWNSSSEHEDLDNITNEDSNACVDFPAACNDGDDIHYLQQAPLGSKKCITELGCFVVTKSFIHQLYRPINFLPQDRRTINTKFFLYTKSHPKEHHELKASQTYEIEKSPIDAKHPTIFIVHGFFDSRFYGKWMEILKDNLLLNSAFNVIIVDWSGGNRAPYTQATANTRVVGAEIALMIQILQKIKEISLMDCHIIGHSLGSHIAGYAGSRLNKLGRITGLDPAQPYFQYMPPSVRLDPTDADFVDVIHTDSSSQSFLALGMSQACGHVDFYPNNGMNQPGCLTSPIYSIFLEGLVDATRQFIACNHQRAVDYFTYSVNYKRALQVAYACTKWQDYLDGRCVGCGRDGKKCAIIGFQADKYRPHRNHSRSVKMFLTTSGTAPFWEHTYQITVKLRKPKSGYKDAEGTINLKLNGAERNYDLKLTTKTKGLIHGATYTFLVRQKGELGAVKGLTFSWTNSKWLIFRVPTIYLEYVKVVPMNVFDETKQMMETRKFCYKAGKAIQSQKEVLLSEC